MLSLAVDANKMLSVVGHICAPCLNSLKNLKATRMGISIDR